jgi:hypothetical protein
MLCERCLGLGKEVKATEVFQSKALNGGTQHICGSCAEYEKARNELIGPASRFADAEVKKLNFPYEIRLGADDKNFNYDFWTEIYNKKIKELAIEKGLHHDMQKV